MSRSWYAYDGSGSVQSSSNYLAVTVTPTCTIGRDVCAIYARDTNPKTTNPAPLSSNILYYIANGIAFGGPQPVGPLKKYVYFLPNEG